MMLMTIEEAMADARRREKEMTIGIFGDAREWNVAKKRAEENAGKAMRIHVSGPMSGYADWNEPSFRRVRDILVEAGHTVFIPPHEIEPTLPYRKCMKGNLVWICDHADAMIALPKWHESKGATAERAVAVSIGLPWRAVENIDEKHIMAKVRELRNAVEYKRLREEG